MTFTQLQQYLQEYLETNDTSVIGNIPNFMALALARISTDLRGAVLEVTTSLLPQASQPQPDGFLAATMVQHNGYISTYVDPQEFVELSAMSDAPYRYTLQSGQIKLLPTPVSTDVISLSYYVATGDSISRALPHLLLHCAAMEAEMYQGNTTDAQVENSLYNSDVRTATGWDIQSGPICLGGAR